MRINYSEKRPWGHFDTVWQDQMQQPQMWVKLLFINKGEAISYQQHKYRVERWYVLKGNPRITINQIKRELVPTSFVCVQKNTPHQISADVDDVVILELAFGKEVREDDILRILDRYGRN